jgi:hypothetical protein
MVLETPEERKVPEGNIQQADAGASLTYQASQRVEQRKKKKKLDSASIQILKHCNMAAPNINTLM